MNNSTTVDGVEKYLPHSRQSVLQKLKNVATLSELLRIFGACAVIASMSMFLLQGWSSGNDIARYFKLLTQTGLLAGAGLALSLVVKEPKGARLFFGLCLISIVSNFTILGALLYSMLQLDGQLLQYPQMMTWRSVNPTAFIPVCLGAVALMTVIARFSYAIFSRANARLLTVAFIALNILLLVPVRSSLAVSVLVAVAFLTAYRVITTVCHSESWLATAEAKFALATLLLPGIIIAVRSIALYHLDEILVISLSLIGYFLLRQTATRLQDAPRLRSAVEVAMFILGGIVAWQVLLLIPAAQSDLSALIVTLVLLCFAFDQIGHTDNMAWRSFVLNSTVIALFAVNLAPALWASSLWFKLNSFASALLMMAFLNTVKASLDNTSFSTTLTFWLTLATGALLGLEIIEILHLGNWVVVGTIGMSVIIGASLYERYGAKISFKK